MASLKHNLICETCGREFNSSWSTKKTCGRECHRIRINKITGRYAAVNLGIPAGTIGVVSEYRVIMDLLGRGFAVFHASSPASFCDVVAIRGTETYYIEVRTGYKNHDGSLSFSKKLNSGIGKPNLFGVMERNTSDVFYINIEDGKSEVTL